MKSLSTKLRLASKDYSEPGWYFVTLGADFHRDLFGRMNGTKVELNAWGRIVAQAWRGIGGHYGSVETLEVVVMPNHMHGLIRLTPDNRVALGQVVNGFKAQVTREVNKAEGKSCVVWQKNYHEVIVHGLKELKAKAGSIRNGGRLSGRDGFFGFRLIRMRFGRRAASVAWNAMNGYGGWRCGKPSPRRGSP